MTSCVGRCPFPHQWRVGTPLAYVPHEAVWRRHSPFIVTTGPCPGGPCFSASGGVDCRDEPGNDGGFLLRCCPLLMGAQIRSDKIGGEGWYPTHRTPFSPRGRRYPEGADEGAFSRALKHAYTQRIPPSSRGGEGFCGIPPNKNDPRNASGGRCFLLCRGAARAMRARCGPSGGRRCRQRPRSTPAGWWTSPPPCRNRHRGSAGRCAPAW